jgi:lysophospholipid acyltransferase (LPLAT)-like uncharacterized protein
LFVREATVAAMMRRLQFAALALLLPLIVIPIKLIMRSWRRRGPEAEAFEELIGSQRTIIATCHGMFLHLLAYAQLPPSRGRKLVVMLSPSRDGLLLARFLEYFGIGHVFGTGGSRAVAGSREFVRQIRKGEIGVVAVDGPRGPCAIAKDGFLRIARESDAQTFLVITTGGTGLRFGSWDRAHLPLPFAAVGLSLESLAVAGRNMPLALREAQELIVTRGSRMKSPALPPAMRIPLPQ